MHVCADMKRRSVLAGALLGGASLLGGAGPVGGRLVPDDATTQVTDDGGGSESGSGSGTVSTANYTGTGTIADWSGSAEGAGDDVGPGGYTYPTGSDFVDDLFDLVGFSVRERATGAGSANRYQFRFTLLSTPENPRGGDGFSLPFPQLYIRDPYRAGGSTAAREGVDAGFAAPYHYRLVANGFETQALEAPDGTVVSSDVTTSVDGQTIVVEVPTTALDDLAPVADLELAPLLLSYQSGQPGNVRPVAANATSEQFGGGRDDDRNPNVIDMVTPEGVDQSTALSFSATEQAEIPFTPVREGIENLVLSPSGLSGEVVVARTDEVGDDNGPGPYTYPTDSAFYDGAFDLIGFYVVDTGSRYEFVFRLPVTPQDSFGSGNGFSLQFPQVYLRDPDASGGGTVGRDGTEVTFAEPYQRRVVATAFTASRQTVEDASGTEISGDVTVGTYDSIDAIYVDVPKSAVGDVTRQELVAFLFPQGQDFAGIRYVEETNAGFDFGGGLSGSNGGADPNAIDVLTPDGVTQAEALSYTTSQDAIVPFLPARSDAQSKFRAADGSVDADNVRAAREYWSNNRAVPGTNGESLSYADVRDLITATGGDGS